MEDPVVIDLEENEQDENSGACLDISNVSPTSPSESKLAPKDDVKIDLEDLEFNGDTPLHSIYSAILPRGVTTPSSKKTTSEKSSVDTDGKSGSKRSLTETSVKSNDEKVLKLSGTRFKVTPKKSDFIKGIVSEAKSSRHVVGIEKCIDVRSKPKVTRGLIKDTEGIDKIPFWISRPKDVAEIPGYIRSVATRLAYVESQIRKFNAERQSLLSSIWRLNEAGDGNLYPRAMIKQRKVAKTAASDGEAECIIEAKRQMDAADSDAADTPTRTPAEPLTPVDKNLRQGKNLHAQPHKLNMGGMENGVAQKDYGLQDFKSPKYDVSDSLSVSYNLQSDNTVDDDDDEYLHTNEPVQEDLSDESLDNLDPIDFFKDLDFRNLDHQSLVTWLEFFGVKVSLFLAHIENMRQHTTYNQNILQLERIRGLLAPYLGAI